MQKIIPLAYGVRYASFSPDGKYTRYATFAHWLNLFLSNWTSVAGGPELAVYEVSGCML